VVKRNFFLILILFPVFVQAQKSFSLHIIASDKDSSFFAHDFSYRKSFTDTLTRYKELQSLLGRLYKGGYLEATFQNLKKDSTALNATLFVGGKWAWASLKNGNVDDVILNRIGFREKLYDNKPLELQQVNQLTEAILEYCENNGYPFASVKLDSISLNQGKLSAEIFLDKNKLVTIDSLSINGDAKIAKSYLANYLGFRFPSIYREDLIQKISVRMRELPFCSESHPTQIIFNSDHAAINLFLKKKQSSRFDFVLGVLPNSNSTGKLLVTGDGQLNLVNPFGRGENVFVSFSQLQPRTTQAELKADYPYLLNLPFGVDGNFYLYKNDTLYLNVKEQIGLKYLFTGVNYLKLFYKNESSSILSFDSAQIIESKQLPSYLDSRTESYGLEYRYEHLDYRFNPTRGMSLLASGQAGTRKVKENAGITQLKDPNDPEYNFASLYDSLKNKQEQYAFTVSIQNYFRVTSRSVIMAAYHGAGIFSNKIFENELYRIGGFQLMRGFDEQSIYASQYHILTAEYHYLLAQNSFFYLFFDAAYVRNKSLTPPTDDFPYGFGTGINFETRAGIFAVSYALGAQQNNPIQFRTAKIHFGYVNYF